MIRIGPIFAVVCALWSGIPEAVEWIAIVSDVRVALAPSQTPPGSAASAEWAK